MFGTAITEHAQTRNMHLSASVSGVSRLSLFAALLALLTFSCVNEEFDPDKLNNSVQVTPSVAVPIGYLKFRLHSMLNDSTKPDLLEIFEDSMILRYKKKVFSDSLTGLFSFPGNLSASFHVRNEFPLPLPLNTGIPRTSSSQVIDFSMNDTLGADVDSIWINTLAMDIGIRSMEGLQGTIYISSRSFVRDGQMFSASVRFDETARPLSLDGYTIIPEDNQIVLTGGISVDPADKSAQPGEEIVAVDLAFSGPELEAVFGYLGTFPLNLPRQTVNINFFDNIIEGSFHFSNPRVKIFFENSLGIPVSVQMDDFFVTVRDGSTRDITGDSIPSGNNPRVINWPRSKDINRYDQTGRIAPDSLLLNLNNTNIIDILLQAPKDLTFSVAGQVNPPGADSANYIAASNFYSATVEVILPLTGYAEMMVMMDTLEFDFTTFYDKPPEEIRRLEFRVNFINGFPIELNAQMYFADGNYNVKAALFDEAWQVKSGIAGSGCDIEPAESDPVRIVFPRDKIDSISVSKYIFVYASARTAGYDQEPPLEITLCHDHTFEAYIGVIVDAEVNSEDY